MYIKRCKLTFPTITSHWNHNMKKHQTVLKSRGIKFPIFKRIQSSGKVKPNYFCCNFYSPYKLIVVNKKMMEINFGNGKLFQWNSWIS